MSPETTSTDPVLDDLNPDQLAAVTHESGPLLILAGAGSGKTRAITRRIAWLVRSRAVHPGRILAVTFTNKASEEMRGRVAALLGGGDAPRWMGTFHSVCLRLLRMHADRLGYDRGFVVYDDDDQESLLRRILKKEGRQKEGPRAFASYIDLWKNEGLLEPPEAVRPRERRLAEVFRTYQAELKAASAMDFGDLLCQALRLLRDNADLRDHYQDQY